MRNRIATLATILTVIIAVTAPCTASTSAAATPRVNVNTATAQQLMLLPSVGEKTATAIISGRPYADVDELLRAKGIGPRKLEAMRAYVTVTGETTLEVKVKMPRKVKAQATVKEGKE